MDFNQCYSWFSCSGIFTLIISLKTEETISTTYKSMGRNLGLLSYYSLKNGRLLCQSSYHMFHKDCPCVQLAYFIAARNEHSREWLTNVLDLKTVSHSTLSVKQILLLTVSHVVTQHVHVLSPLVITLTALQVCAGHQLCWLNCRLEVLIHIYNCS